MGTLKNAFEHFKTIVNHKRWVFHYARLAGIPIRGLLHDLSKFGPSEFLYNVKYYKPGVSPVTVAKEINGYSDAWFHHKSHNKHHYEYWMDRFDDGCYVARIPFIYSLEMICDYLGAAQAYNPKSKESVYKRECEWWESQKYNRAMHPDNIEFVTWVFKELKYCEDNKEAKIILNKRHLKVRYNNIVANSKYDTEVQIGNRIYYGRKQ